MKISTSSKDVKDAPWGDLEFVSGTGTAQIWKKTNEIIDLPTVSTFVEQSTAHGLGFVPAFMGIGTGSVIDLFNAEIVDCVLPKIEFGTAITVQVAADSTNIYTRAKYEEDTPNVVGATAASLIFCYEKLV